MNRYTGRIFMALAGMLLATAAAEELSGIVTTAAPGRVTIELSGELLPAKGDPVRIFTEVPGIGPQPIRGDWQVVNATNDTVEAGPTTPGAGTPTRGDAVVIQSASPRRPAPLPPISRISWDDPQAAALLQRGCDEGRLNYCGRLGIAYQYGEGGVEEDPAHAARLFRRICEQGLWQGCEDLAVQYATGAGVRKDLREAAEFYGMACEGGVETACAVVEPYRAAASRVIDVRRGSTADFESFAGLSRGDRTRHVSRLFGDPDHATPRQGGSLLEIGYDTPSERGIQFLYEQDSGRIGMVAVQCTARAWVAERVGRTPSLDRACQHESLLVARYGPPSKRKGEQLEYELPKRRGTLFVTCRDEKLNVCEHATVIWD